MWEDVTTLMHSQSDYWHIRARLVCRLPNMIVRGVIPFCSSGSTSTWHCMYTWRQHRMATVCLNGGDCPIIMWIGHGQWHCESVTSLGDMQMRWTKLMSQQSIFYCLTMCHLFLTDEDLGLALPAWVQSGLTGVTPQSRSVWVMWYSTCNLSSSSPIFHTLTIFFSFLEVGLLYGFSCRRSFPCRVVVIQYWLFVTSVTSFLFAWVKSTCFDVEPAGRISWWENVVS